MNKNIEKPVVRITDNTFILQNYMSLTGKLTLNKIEAALLYVELRNYLIGEETVKANFQIEM